MLIYVLVFNNRNIPLAGCTAGNLGWVAISRWRWYCFPLPMPQPLKGKGRDVFTNVISLLSLQEEKLYYLDTHVGIRLMQNPLPGEPGDQVLNVSSNGQNGSMRVTSSYPGVTLQPMKKTK